MFCEKCGNEISEGVAFCPNCGAPVAPVTPAPEQAQPQYQQAQPDFQAAPQYQQAQPDYQAAPQYQQPQYQQASPQYQQTAAPGGAPKSKLAAGLLGIFLGSLGIHNFYLGFTKRAVIQLLISLLTCGVGAPVIAIWALIEGIFYLTAHEGYTTDANGVPLTD